MYKHLQILLLALTRSPFFFNFLFFFLKTDQGKPRITQTYKNNLISLEKLLEYSSTTAQDFVNFLSCNGPSQAFLAISDNEISRLRNGRRVISSFTAST